jgi:hypothetical protein
MHVDITHRKIGYSIVPGIEMDYNLGKNDVELDVGEYAIEIDTHNNEIDFKYNNEVVFRESIYGDNNSICGCFQFLWNFINELILKKKTINAVNNPIIQPKPIIQHNHFIPVLFEKYFWKLDKTE